MATLEPLYKIVSRTLWLDAEATGSFSGAPIDRDHGFIHLSTRAQLEGTFAKHFADAKDLLLVLVDPSALGDAVRYEPARGGELFPHLYAPLPLSAVRAVLTCPEGEDGRPRLPNLS